MRTNGCTMSYYVPGVGQVSCANHARMGREEVSPHARRGPVVKRTTYRGAMRKYANWRHERSVFAELDALAARKAAPTGLIIRRKAGG